PSAPIALLGRVHLRDPPYRPSTVVGPRPRPTRVGGARRMCVAPLLAGRSASSAVALCGPEVRLVLLDVARVHEHAVDLFEAGFDPGDLLVAQRVLPLLLASVLAQLHHLFDLLQRQLV